MSSACWRAWAAAVARRYSTAPVRAPQSSKKIPIISCKRPDFDHYKGQTYSKFEGVPLASSGWNHPKSRRDHFTIHQEPEGAAQLSDDSPHKTFRDVGVSADISEVLESLGYTKPTTIQLKAIPSILAGNNTMVTAETGCGKTLAYLLPILQSVIEWKHHIENEEFNSPLAVVITPSRELAIQIGEVATDIAKSFNLNVTTLVGGKTKKTMLNPPVEYCDILVATLGAFSKLVTTGIYKIHNVHHLVLDEADTLLDDTFSEKLSHLLQKFRIQYKSDLNMIPPVGCQLTMASATMPFELPQAVGSFADPESLKTVATKHIHKIMPHVPQKFIRLGKAQKPMELLKLVQADVNMKRPVMIFSNKTETCDWVSMFLNENKVECININGRMAVPLKLGKYELYRTGKVTVLSCTDIASRGLDTVMTQHVINYDFPLYTADYIHRCGRTGRLGSHAACSVTNFIAWPREVALVQRIETSVRRDEPLPSVNANIRRLIDNRIANFVKKDIRSMDKVQGM